MGTEELIYQCTFLQIPVVADLPVGQNLQDHLFFDVGVRIREPLTTAWSSLFQWQTMLQYKLFGTGIRRSRNWYKNCNIYNT